MGEANQAGLRRPGDRLLGWLLGGIFAVLFTLTLGHIVVRVLSPAPPGPGDPAPAFSLASPIDGARISSEDLRGMVLLLDFWETTCVGCVGATPKLNRLHERFVDRGFLVIGVNREPDREEEVRRFVERRDIRYPVAIDPGHVSEAYGIFATPTVVLIGADGLIRATHRGPVTERTLAEEIEAALEAARPRHAVRSKL